MEMDLDSVTVFLEREKGTGETREYQAKEDKRDGDYELPHDTSTVEVDEEARYCIVSMESLLELFRVCMICRALACAIKVNTEVTLLVFCD